MSPIVASQVSRDDSVCVVEATAQRGRYVWDRARECVQAESCYTFCAVSVKDTRTELDNVNAGTNGARLSKSIDIDTRPLKNHPPCRERRLETKHGHQRQSTRERTTKHYRGGEARLAF